MATLPSPPEDLTPEQLYLGHLKLIDQIAAYAAKRRNFSREETEDFVATVRFKLFEKDYARIRQFQGRSTFPSYILSVIGHLFEDYCNHIWGKWRVSEEAKRLGPAAVRLDVLLFRERLTFEEACEILRTNEGMQLSRQELADLAAQLPTHNPPRRMSGEEGLADWPAADESPEARVRGQEAAKRWEEVLAILRQCKESHPPEDQLIAKMRGEFSVVQISKALKLEQKPLYRRIEKILKALRNCLEQHGVTREELAEILAFPERSVDG